MLHSVAVLELQLLPTLKLRLNVQWLKKYLYSLLAEAKFAVVCAA